MDQGYYAKKFRKLGEGWHLHFFEPAVLDRFRNDPNYEVSDTRVSTKDGTEAELSGIQQYVWGHKVDGQPCIVVLLPHLCDLSVRDQLHWHTFELPPNEASGAKVEARYKGAMLCGEFPDTISGYQAIFFYLREIQKVFDPDKLLLNLTDRLPPFLAPLPFNTRRAMASFAQDLLSLLSMNLTVLSTHLTLPASRAKASDLLKRQQSRNLIKLYFEDRGYFSKGIEDLLEAFRELNEWRVESAHKLVPAEQDQDYVAVQAQFVHRLQQGLKIVLLGFIQAEGKTPDWTCETVLQYKVG
jgi:hypothetical protein